MNILKKLFGLERKGQYDGVISELEQIYKFAQIDFGGGCSYEKALTMVAFIKEFSLQVSVDIGVYRGRSLFPQALAHKHFSSGIVYGIDPYDNIAAIQNDKPELKQVLDEFAERTDFNMIYNEVNSLLEKNKLSNNCKIIRQKSEDAKNFFSENKLEIGLVHIDGNHDTSFVLQDVNDYLPLVQSNGVIILDDISWDSVRPAMDILEKKCLLIGQISDSKSDFAIFLKNGSTESIKVAKKIFIEIKNYSYPSA